MTSLGCFNPGQADLVLSIAAVEYDDGVTVNDAHNAAGEGVCYRLKTASPR